MACLAGNQAMYDRFHKAREQYFNKNEQNGQTVRQNIALQLMSEDIVKNLRDDHSVFVTGKLGKTLDIKRGFYRFVEQFLTNLGFYHKCKSQNSIDIANELVSRGILSPKLGDTIVDFIQFATGLRLKEQSIIKRQGKAAYFDQNAFDEDKAEAELEIKLLEQSITHMKKSNIDPESLSIKNREMAKLKFEYDHLVEMAPR